MKKVVTDQQKTTIKKVLDYIRRYWFYLGLSIVLAAVTVALTLYIPILPPSCFLNCELKIS